MNVKFLKNVSMFANVSYQENFLDKQEEEEMFIYWINDNQEPLQKSGLF